MRLKKQKLLNITRQKIHRLGYMELDDTFFGAEGLFVKQVSNDFFLTLGLVISRFHENLFSASFYLSKSTRWSSIWGDIPKESYTRISSLLNYEERSALLPSEFSDEKSKDGWWNPDNEGVEKFVKTLEITETRLLEQPNLFNKIENSEEVKILISDVNAVEDILSLGIPNGLDFKFIPPKVTNKIPLEYFKAAEIAIKQRNGILNTNTVKFLAADAWYQYRAKKLE